MVLIFGWGQGQVLDRGDAVSIVCPTCHNPVWLRAIRSQQQVSLYFVPLASYGSNEYLACPICRHGVEVPPQDRSTVDAMVAATRMVRNGQLAPDAYQAQAERFLVQMGLTSAAVPAAAPSTAGPESASDLADRLASLAKLHADGVLTDAEFDAAKRRALAG